MANYIYVQICILVVLTYIIVEVINMNVREE